MPYGQTSPQVTGPGHILTPDKPRQVRDRLQGLARQEPGLGVGQLPQAPAQGGQLSAADPAGPALASTAAT